MNIREFETYLKAASNWAGVRISDVVLGYYPYKDVVTQAEYPAVVIAGKAQEIDNAYVVAVIYLALDGEEQFHIWCGDSFLEDVPEKSADSLARIKRATQGFPPSKAASIAEGMKKLMGVFPRAPKCTFWAGWRREGSLCKHTETFLANLKENRPNFIDELRGTYATLNNESVSEFSFDLGLSRLAFQVPVLFEGDRGSGKTTTAREFARQHGYPCIEFGGHEGLEAPDMLGFLVPYKDGQLVWKDGPLAEAFRRAAKEKVVLIIDELLRIRQRELSLLLTALSPDRDVYRLRTGRIRDVVDGVALEEELTCPTENLCVIATTNVGAEYAVDDIDPALAERFVVIRKDTTAAELTQILRDVAKKKGFSAKVAANLVKFFEKMEEARARGMLKHAPTTRTLVRALTIAKEECEVADALRMQGLLWVARDSDGRPVQEQLETLEKILSKIFPPSN